MKFINLILYNKNEKYDAMKSCLEKYLNTLDIKYFFYCYSEDITSEYEFSTS